MELAEIQSFVSENVDEDEDNFGLDLLVAMSGKFAEGRIALETHGIEDPDRAEFLGDVLAGMVTIIAHIAVEEGVDLDAAAEERMSAMRQEKEQQEDLEQMIEDADYEGLAEALGMVHESDDTDTGRAFA